MRTERTDGVQDRRRRPVVLAVLVGLVLAGAVALNRFMPHSSLGSVLFMLGIFLGLPTAVAEFQPGKSAAPNDEGAPPVKAARPDEPVRSSGEAGRADLPRFDVTEMSYRCGSNLEPARIPAGWACQWGGASGKLSLN